MDFSLKLSDSTNRQHKEIKLEGPYLMKNCFNYYVGFASTDNNKVEFGKEYTLEITADEQRGSMEIPLR